jgi:hypothetical protein
MKGSNFRFSRPPKWKRRGRWQNLVRSKVAANPFCWWLYRSGIATVRWSKPSSYGNYSIEGIKAASVAAMLLAKAGAWTGGQYPFYDWIAGRSATTPTSQAMSSLGRPAQFCSRFFAVQTQFRRQQRRLEGELAAGALRWPRAIPTAVGGRQIIVEQLTPA